MNSEFIILYEYYKLKNCIFKIYNYEAYRNMKYWYAWKAYDLTNFQQNKTKFNKTSFDLCLDRKKLNILDCT